MLAGRRADAQQYNVSAITNTVLGVAWNGGTNNLASNNIAGTNLVTATKLKNFGEQLNAKLNAAGTAGVLLTADYSGDGTNYITGVATNWVAMAGTTTTSLSLWFTNTVAGYWRFSFLNSNTVPMTNIQFLKIDPGVKGL